ncbi:MAG: MarR family transcriptional regulator [Pseudomonadota bacterium]
MRPAYDTTTDDLPPLQLDDQFCFGLYAATNAVVRAYRVRLQTVGLTYPQYLVLLVLWQDGQQSAGEIASRLHLAPNAITPLLTRLERAGHIARKDDRDGDRRKVSIALTRQGRALERRVAAIQNAVACDTGFTYEEMATIRDRLHDMVTRMEKIAGGELPETTKTPRKSSGQTRTTGKRARSSKRRAA